MDDLRRDQWDPYVTRYRSGEWRAPIFCDMILSDAKQYGSSATMLDIGCGNGFDGDCALQKTLSSASNKYIGIEPDKSVFPADHIHQLYRCTFEESPVEPESIDIILATMVLEHIRKPKLFWEKVWEVLREDGVFWGFTMDRRHYFCTVSMWAEKLRIKNFYLRLTQGERGTKRYENYSTYYRANTPREIKRDTTRFKRCDFINFSRVGQIDYYVPGCLQLVTHLVDRVMIAARAPGSLLVIRIQK